MEEGRGVGGEVYHFWGEEIVGGVMWLIVRRQGIEELWGGVVVKEWTGRYFYRDFKVGGWR